MSALTPRNVYGPLPWPPPKRYGAGATQIIEGDQIYQGPITYNNIVTLAGLHIPLPTVDHTYTGITVPGTAGETLALFELCYLETDGLFWKTDADAAGSTNLQLALVTGAMSANETNGRFLVFGFARDDSWGWTVSGKLYVSTTAGAITTSQVSATGDQSRKVGFARTADIVWFNPDHTILGLA